MNKTDKHDDDILKQYIDTDSVENAPENFTHILMTRIRHEPVPMGLTARFRARYLIPAISIIITLILITIASGIPGDTREPLNLIRLIQNIELPDFNFSFESLLNLDLPVLATYLFTGILFLGVFDMALSGLFHRMKK